jgi:succinoglycan biosynthesis transport protein ExoP
VPNLNQPSSLPQAPVSQHATAREFLAVVFRRKFLILGLLATTTLTVLVIAMITPTVYVSVGRVLVKRGEQQSVLTPYRQVVNDWEADLASEIEVAKSYPVLQRAREILAHETGAPLVHLNGRQVDAQVLGKSTVVALAYEDRDPEVAQRVCDALLRAYIDYRQNTLTLNYSRSFFEVEIGKVRKDLDVWMERRRAYADSNHLADVTEQTRNMLDVVGALEKQRGDLASELAQVSATIDAMHMLQERPDVDLPLLGSNGSGDAILEIKRRVLDQEARLATIRERYRDGSPEATNAAETLKTLREMLQREVNNRVEMSESRIHGLKAALAVTDRDIAQRQAQISAMPDKQIQLAVMDREIAVLKTRYENLSKDGDQARVTQNTSPTLSVVLLSPAGPASSKTSRDYVRLALAPVFSVVIGIGLAFFIDGLDVTLRTSGQAEEAIELPVLATLNDRRRPRRAEASGVPRS